MLGDGDVDVGRRVAEFVDVVPRRAPGSGVEYSNANHLVLGTLTVAAAGLTLLRGALRPALAWTALRRPRGA